MKCTCDSLDLFKGGCLCGSLKEEKTEEPDIQVKGFYELRQSNPGPIPSSLRCMICGEKESICKGECFPFLKISMVEHVNFRRKNKPVGAIMCQRCGNYGVSVQDFNAECRGSTNKKHYL